MGHATFARAALLAAFTAMLALAPFSSVAADDADVAGYKRAVERRFAEWLQALWPEAQAAGV
jgi:membrane-bound lytic murein transglycosylase B